MSMLTGRISDTLTCPPFVTRLSNIEIGGKGVRHVGRDVRMRRAGIMNWQNIGHPPYQASLTCCCLGREPIRFLSSFPGSAMASSPNAMKRPASAEAEAEPDIAKKRRVFSGVQDEAHLAGSSDDDAEGCTVFHITRGLTGHATTVCVASSANVAKIVEALRSQMGLRANASLILVCGNVALSGTEFVAELPSTRLQVIVAKESTFEMVGPEREGDLKYINAGQENCHKNSGCEIEFI